MALLLVPQTPFRWKSSGVTALDAPALRRLAAMPRIARMAAPATVFHIVVGHELRLSEPFGNTNGETRPRIGASA
jgi:hypothetical protein